MNFSLTEREENLIKSSWKMVQHEVGISNQLIFYDAFFKVAPEAKKYFEKQGRTDFEKLSRKFIYTMNFIIENVHQLDKIPEELEDLGSIHKKIDISPKYYILFNQSLIGLLDEVLKEKSSKEIKEAWGKILDFISVQMQNSSEKKANKFQEFLKKLFG